MTGGRVAVLGETGRNFAAGMSGGIAYIYDKAKNFSLRCNMGSVDLKTLHEDSVDELRSMLENHVKYTDSAVAKSILENWEDEMQHFVRVMPRDYARVLKQQKQIQAEVTHAS